MKLLFSEKAEGELVGHVIILGITVLGVSMISLYGIPAIYSLQDIANVKNVEQTFTVLDSQASRAVIGESPLQITNINLGGGSLTVEPNSTDSPSYIMVNSTIFNFTIPMGKIEYQLGDRIVAYEGGGVWSKYPSGSVMLSRPEFHYNGVTLTLPVFNISGNTSVGGRGTAVVSVKKPETRVVFPNNSRSDWVNRTNPVNYTQVGKVYVTIRSDFYDAWAEHVATLSSVEIVSTDEKNSTTEMALTVYPDYVGKIDSDITDPIIFRGVSPSNSTPLNNFSFAIKTPTGGNDLKWDIRTQSADGNRRLIFEFEEGGGGKVTLNIGYIDESQDNEGETWEGDKVLQVQANDYVYVDLLNSSLNLTYKSKNVGQTSSVRPGCAASDKINGISNPDYSWDGIDIRDNNANKTQSLYNITQHYIQLMAQGGDFSFSQCSPSDNNHDPETMSTMSIDYSAPGGLTYLHITDNRADIKIS